MAASPVQPSPDDAGQSLALLAWIWGLIYPFVMSIFGGGIVWGVSRTTTADHGRRISELEKGHKDGIERINDKIDDRFDKLNDRFDKLNDMIFKLARKKDDD